MTVDGPGWERGAARRGVDEGWSHSPYEPSPYGGGYDPVGQGGPGRPDGGLTVGVQLAGALLGVVFGAACSVVTTEITATVVGRYADRALEPVEFAIRVGLLLAAPCMGAVLAALLGVVLLQGRLRLASWAIGLGSVAGPLLALRLDRLTAFGAGASAAAGGLIFCWVVVGTVLAAAASARTAPRARRSGTGLPRAPDF